MEIQGDYTVHKQHTDDDIIVDNVTFQIETSVLLMSNF